MEQLFNSLLIIADGENITRALFQALPWNYFLFNSFRTCYIILCLKSQHLSLIKQHEDGLDALLKFIASGFKKNLFSY